jgi:hypothetical protein
MKIKKDHINTLLKHTLGNNGASVRLIDNTVLGYNLDLKSGYMVSIKDLLTLPFKTDEGLLLDFHDNLVKGLINIECDDNTFLGAWLDEGLLYIDLSMHIENKDEALKLAKDNHQKAIWDVKNNKSIYL